jgi:hypothetical protein
MNRILVDQGEIPRLRLQILMQILEAVIVIIQSLLKAFDICVSQLELLKVLVLAVSAETFADDLHGVGHPVLEHRLRLVDLSRDCFDEARLVERG